MNRYFDRFDIDEKARALRSRALAGIARGAAIRWRALVALPTEKASAAPTAHAPLPCQGPTPSHP
jgi:hypothetical protein